MKYVWLIMAVFVSYQVSAGEEAFHDGPQIKGYGKHAKINQDFIPPKNSQYKVAFDTSEQSGNGKPNRSFNSLARFINMHVANGVAPENIQLALVVHGKATYDLLSNDAYRSRFNKSNPNHELLNLLMKNKVNIILCGQSAAYYDVGNSDLQSGVKMALSAMTAHAVLQEQGYRLNPF